MNDTSLCSEEAPNFEIGGLQFAKEVSGSDNFVIVVKAIGKCAEAVEFIAQSTDGSWDSNVVAVRKGTELPVPRLDTLRIRIFSASGNEIASADWRVEGRASPPDRLSSAPQEQSPRMRTNTLAELELGSKPVRHLNRKILRWAYALSVLFFLGVCLKVDLSAQREAVRRQALTVQSDFLGSTAATIDTSNEFLKAFEQMRLRLTDSAQIRWQAFSEQCERWLAAAWTKSPSLVSFLVLIVGIFSCYSLYLLAQKVSTRRRLKRGPFRIDYEGELTRMCGGNRRQADRLIKYELSRTSEIKSRAGAAMAAVARLRQDRGR